MTQKKNVKNTNGRAVSRAELRANRQMGRIMTLIMIAVSILAAVALIINVVLIGVKSSPSSASSKHEETENLSMSSDTGKSIRNDQYTIGNNPTDVQKEYFQKLTDALKGGDEKEICEAVVYNFVADYFTWTNKDGNYEVGGLQYIYGGKVAVFSQWSRYNFYSDMDLYIAQDGRDRLIEVTEVTTDKPVEKAPDFETYEFKDEYTREDIYLPCYEVNVSWKYKSGGIYTDDFPQGGRFFVVNNNGRWEIAEFYDYESIHDWEASQGASDED